MSIAAISTTAMAGMGQQAPRSANTAGHARANATFPAAAAQPGPHAHADGLQDAGPDRLLGNSAAGSVGSPKSRALLVLDSAAPEMFAAIYTALDAVTRPVTGPAKPRLLVIPVRNDAGAVAGGLWGYTLFEWLHVQMLFVPQPLRGMRVGSALLATAEAEARDRGCRGVHLDAFSFQAAPFYQKLGYRVFGRLADFPPGHDRLYFYKRLTTDGWSGESPQPATRESTTAARRR